MLLTISTTYTPATDLGYLLAKNPAKLHSFRLGYGQAHVFYPVATPERCTAALLLDIDPIGQRIGATAGLHRAWTTTGWRRSISWRRRAPYTRHTTTAGT